MFFVLINSLPVFSLSLFLPMQEFIDRFIEFYKKLFEIEVKAGQEAEYFDDVPEELQGEIAHGSPLFLFHSIPMLSSIDPRRVDIRSDGRPC